MYGPVVVKRRMKEREGKGKGEEMDEE